MDQLIPVEHPSPSPKHVPLTRGYVALVDDADYERVSQHRWRARLGKRTVYAVTDVDRKVVRLHRFILGVTDPQIQVDHEDRNGLNNQRRNLRICTNQQNACNKTKRAGCKSNYKGVSWSVASRKWRAQFTVNRKMQHLGLYTSEVDAALAYDTAARQQYGEFALCNFPPRKPCVNSALAYMIGAEEIPA